MPNLKLHIDESLYPERRDRVARLLPALRQLLCERLAVQAQACQIAVLPVGALPDQPQVNLELAILASEGRSPQRLGEVAENLRAAVQLALDLTVAVRIQTLQSDSYLVLK